MIWLVAAWALYAFCIHEVMSYDDADFGMVARFFHSMYRGVIVLVFIYCVLRGFTQIGVLT
jgi:hypothetical protein